MITRARIRRHLYKGGGITTLRQKYGAGDLVRKLIPNELARVAEVAAPIAAIVNPALAPWAAAAAGLGRYDRTGKLGSSALYAGGTYLAGAASPGLGKWKVADTGYSSPGRDLIRKGLFGVEGGAAGQGATKGLFGAGGEFAIKKAIGQGMPGVFLGTTALALLGNKLAGPKEDDETIEDYMERRKTVVAKYLRQYYKNLNPTSSAADVEAFVQRNSGYAKGGRVGYDNGGRARLQTGGTFQDYLKQRNIRQITPGSEHWHSGMQGQGPRYEILSPGGKSYTVLGKDHYEVDPNDPYWRGWLDMQRGTNYDKASTPVAGDTGLASTVFPEGEFQNIRETSKTPTEYNIRATKDLVENLPGGAVRDVLAPAAAGVMSIPYDAIQAATRTSEADVARAMETAGMYGPKDIAAEAFGTAYARERPLSTAMERMTGAAGPLAERVANLRKRGIDERMARTYAENIKLMADPRMTQNQAVLPTSGYDTKASEKKAAIANLLPDLNLAKGGRIKYALGTPGDDNGLMALKTRMNSAGVKELDLRDDGGFIPPIGVKEKADDIPAMVSNNEFVMTADAVRGLGNGNVEKGAQRMYDVMKSLENRVA